MKLPNAEQAFIDLSKLRNYSLSQTHPRGKNKARLFATLLGLTANDAELLRDTVLAAVLGAEAKVGERDSFGSRYIVDFEMQGLTKKVIVRTAWIIRTSEDFPRLTSCYIL